MTYEVAGTNLIVGDKNSLGSTLTQLSQCDRSAKAFVIFNNGGVCVRSLPSAAHPEQHSGQKTTGRRRDV